VLICLQIALSICVKVLLCVLCVLVVKFLTLKNPRSLRPPWWIFIKLELISVNLLANRSINSCQSSSLCSLCLSGKISYPKKSLSLISSLTLKNLCDLSVLCGYEFLNLCKSVINNSFIHSLSFLYVLKRKSLISVPFFLLFFRFMFLILNS
jgi:hypothetical protein